MKKLLIYGIAGIVAGLLLENQAIIMNSERRRKKAEKLRKKLQEKAAARTP